MSLDGSGGLTGRAAGKFKGLAHKRGFLGESRETLRSRHLAYRTEQQCVYCIPRYVAFHHWRYPCDLEAPEVEQFLTHLAFVQPSYGAPTRIRTWDLSLRRRALYPLSYRGAAQAF